MKLETLLKECLEQGASDLHLSAGEPPRMRVHGALVPIAEAPIPAGTVRAMFDMILYDYSRAVFEEHHEVDFSMQLDFGRFRVNLFTHSRGLGGVFRAIPARVPTLEELGLPAVFQELCRRDRGLILVTGPTGCGKSTTLAAMLDQINQTRECHILTIEDPIEFVHESRRALVTHREVGPHTNAFAAALRAGLREDPDVILIGEMRDLETISLALTAAETGHLVLATLHSRGAQQTVERVVDVFPPEQQNQTRIMLADALEAVTTQTLVPRQDAVGLVAAHEIMVATPSIRSLIREGKTAQLPSALQTGSRHGMQTLDKCLEELYRWGKISREVALHKASRPQMLKI